MGIDIDVGGRIGAMNCSRASVRVVKVSIVCARGVGDMVHTLPLYSTLCTLPLTHSDRYAQWADQTIKKTFERC